MVIEGTFYFDPEDRIYEDHFPDRAVVPGSLIVHAFLEALKAAGWEKGCRLVENFDFREFVSPGAYRFRMETSAGGFRCRLYRDERIVAKGLIKNGHI